jgi:hypothetical protein
MKNLGLPEHIFRDFRVSFHDLLLKNQVAAVSHEAVTLRMMSNNRISALVINDHLLIEETSGEYSSDRKRLEKISTIILQVTLDRFLNLGSNLHLKESIVHVKNRWMRLICGCYSSSAE